MVTMLILGIAFSWGDGVGGELEESLVSMSHLSDRLRILLLYFAFCYVYLFKDLTSSPTKLR